MCVEVGAWKCRRGQVRALAAGDILSVSTQESEGPVRLMLFVKQIPARFGIE